MTEEAYGKLRAYFQQIDAKGAEPGMEFHSLELVKALRAMPDDEIMALAGKVGGDEGSESSGPPFNIEEFKKFLEEREAALTKNAGEASSAFSTKEGTQSDKFPIPVANFGSGPVIVDDTRHGQNYDLEKGRK